MKLDLPVLPLLIGLAFSSQSPVATDRSPLFDDPFFEPSFSGGVRLQCQNTRHVRPGGFALAANRKAESRVCLGSELTAFFVIGELLIEGFGVALHETYSHVLPGATDHSRAKTRVGYGANLKGF